MMFTIFLNLFFLSKTINTLTTSVPTEMVSILNITKSKQSDDVCILDYSLGEDFKDLPTPPWLKTWDDAMPNTFCKDKYDIKTQKGYDAMQTARRLLFSLTSGYAVDSWHEMALKKRFENTIMEEMMDNLWNTGQIQQSFGSEVPNPYPMKKRTIVESLDPRWGYSGDNKAAVLVLKSIQKDLEAQGDKIIELKEAAICKTVNTNFGCLSWSGGSRSIRANVGAVTIKSGIGNHGDHESLSGLSDKALVEVNLHTACLGSSADCRT